MKRKNPKDNKGKKLPQQPNTFVPQNLLTSVREQKMITCPEDAQNNLFEYTPLAQPFEIPPEWVQKSEEEFNDELFPEEYKLQLQQKQETIQKTIEKPIEKKPNKSEKKKDSKTNTLKKDKQETIEAKEENNLPKEEEEVKEQEIIIPSYNDNDHEELINNLPLSFLKVTRNNFVWMRPEDYVINEILDKEIKRLYPKKKYIQMREDIKQTYKIEKEQNKLKDDENKNYSEEENVDAFMNDDSVTLKKTIYKDFYKYLENKPQIRIVNAKERDETEEEYQKRVYDTIEKQKDMLARFKMSKNKNEKKPIVQKPEEIQRIKVYDQEPSNIDVKQLVEKEKICRTFKEKNDFRAKYSFISWISSVFQFILDLKINDCTTSKSIFNNIYPQQNGSPVFNPNGHYAIRLYFMGKPRRIDIDDRMPCNENGEFLFPRCEELGELWPALLTKALLKLNIYKVKHPFYSKYEENVDTSYIYELTGYHTQILQDINQELEIQNLLSTNLNDDNYLNKKKYILCLNLFNQKKEGEKKDRFYEDIIESYKKDVNANTNVIKEEGIIEEEEEENTKSRYGKNRVKFDQSYGFNRAPSSLTDQRPHLNVGKKISQSQIKMSSDVAKKNTFSPFRFGITEKKNFKFVLGKENITESYWKSRDVTKQRAVKRQKTISLKGKLFIDNKIEIIHNFAYSINDFFFNGNFNMNRLKALDFEDLKRNLKANNVVFKQLNQTEKREYIKQRKILKAKQLDIKNKRIEELQNEGKPFLIIKIKNESYGQYKINSVLMYTEEEIYMAKKCILNNWKYPPPDFFSKHFKKYEQMAVEEDEKKSENLKNNEKVKKKKISAFDWTRENYIQLIGADLAKFENTEENHIKDPILKTSGGTWMSFSDFIFLFNTFLILHNPNSLFNGGKIAMDNNWLDYKLDCFEPLDDFMVLKLNKEEIGDKEKSYISFLVFQPNNDKTLEGKDKIDNYIILDIVDENQNIVYDNITMNKFYSTHIVENLMGDTNYYIIIRGGIYEFGFYLEFFSEAHKIENMNYQNYLCQALDYKSANFKIEHPLIGSEPFYLLTRLHILPNVNEDGTQIPDGEVGDFDIVFNVKYPIKHLKRFIKLFIQKEEKDNNYNVGKEIFINQKIHLNEGSYLVAIYFQNLTGAIKENAGDIDVVYSNKNYHIEQIDNIDYYEVGDEYKPNKYNILFKEKIFSCDNIYSSLDIQLKNNLKAKNVEDEKKIDKLKLIFLLYQLTDKENAQVPFIEKKYSHGLRGNLIHKFESYNSMIIPNIKFKGGLIIPDKKAGKNVQPQTEPQFYPYLLICYIDDDSFDITNYENKLLWKIRVFSSDNLCFIGDESKEENEKLLKNGWEEKEPGRAALAKISRKRFILENLRKSGAELNNDDIVLLNSQRIRKVTKPKEEQELNQTLNKNKRTNQKIQINAKKNEDKEVKKEETKEMNLNFNKCLPRDIHHQSNYIKNYLKYAYKERTYLINNIEDQYLKIINNEEIQTEKSKNITESLDFFNKTVKTDMFNTFYKTTKPKEEMFSTFYKLDLSTRTSEIDSLRELMKSRDTLKMQFKEKINAENTVIDVLKNYILNNYDYAYMLQAYKDTVEILGKDYDDEVKLFKLLSSKKEEEIKNQLKKFTAKDKNNITKLLEEIEFNQLLISEEVMAKLREFIK